MMTQAKPDSWKREPFGAGVPLPYRTKLDSNQFQQVQLGLIPEQMEDKWFVYYQKPYLYFHRSWTGLPIYRLTFEERDGMGEVVEVLLSADRVTNSLDVNYEVHLLDFLLYAVVLHEFRKFPLPDAAPGEPRGVLQHHISGTSYPEAPPKAKKE